MSMMNCCTDVVVFLRRNDPPKALLSVPAVVTEFSAKLDWKPHTLRSAV
jgi:hypothetical protein